MDSYPRWTAQLTGTINEEMIGATNEEMIGRTNEEMIEMMNEKMIYVWTKAIERGDNCKIKGESQGWELSWDITCLRDKKKEQHSFMRIITGFREPIKNSASKSFYMHVSFFRENPREVTTLAKEIQKVKFVEAFQDTSSHYASYCKNIYNYETILHILNALKEKKPLNMLNDNRVKEWLELTDTVQLKLLVFLHYADDKFEQETKQE